MWPSSPPSGMPAVLLALEACDAAFFDADGLRWAAAVRFAVMRDDRTAAVLVIALCLAFNLLTTVGTPIRCLAGSMPYWSVAWCRQPTASTLGLPVATRMRPGLPSQPPGAWCRPVLGATAVTAEGALRTGSAKITDVLGKVIELEHDGQRCACGLAADSCPPSLPTIGFPNL